MKKFLALTSLDEAMDPSAEEIIYIENGCLKRQCKTKKHKCLERPFHMAQEVLEKIQIASEVYEQILKELSIKLNEIHSLDLSIEAWRPILHIWLPYYIEEMYSKYLHVQKAMEDYPDIYTNILARSSFIHPYYGVGCWSWSLRREDYNFQLYSHVAQFKRIEVKNQVDLKQSISSVKVSKKVKFGERLFNFLGQKAKTIVINPSRFGFSCIELWELIIKSNFKIGFFFSEAMNFTPKEYDGNYRKNFKLECRKSDSEFVRMIKEYVFEDIPTMYLEGFTESFKALEGYRCKNIISSEEYIFYTAALLMGKVKNDGGKLYTVPLGGDGNVWQGLNEARMDALISDVLYTTGWKDISFKCELRKITNPRYWSAHKNVQYRDKKNDILYLASATFSYCTLMSNPNSIFSKEFMDDNISLMKALVNRNFKICARFFIDTGWGLDERILALGEHAKIDDYNRKFIETVFESKLCVMDSFGTGWAEALVMNVPFVIVIPKYMEFFSEAGWKLVNRFREIGMYFNDYQEAEEHISEIICAVDSWWWNDKRQKVLTQICDEYAWCAKNAKEEWIGEFLNISRE